MKRAWLVCGLLGCRSMLGIEDPSIVAGDAIDARSVDDALDAAIDLDEDGVPDGFDNCVAVANPDQRDEDIDQRGNACDNCPHLANVDQANADGDGVGDVCDPQATVANTISLFLGFDDPVEISAWSIAGSNAVFEVSGGRLRQTSPVTDLALIWRNDLAIADARVITNVHYEALYSFRYRGIAVMTRFERTTGFGTGAGCGEMRDTQIDGDKAFFNLVRFGSGGFFNAVQGAGATVQAGHSQTYETRGVSSTSFACRVGASPYAGSVTAQPGAGVALATWGVAASFDYLIVID